ADVLQEGASVTTQQDRQCEIAAEMRAMSWQILFPDDPIAAKWGFQFHKTIAPFKFSIPFQPDPVFISPLFVGCILYGDAYSADIHHTWFSFTIGKAADNGGFAFIEAHPQTISDVRFSRSLTIRNDGD